MKINLKKILKEVAIFAVMLFVIANVMSTIRAPELESDRFPEIKEVLIDGSIFQSSEVHHQPIVVHFWATWCPTCKLEAPNIQSVSEEYTVLTIAVQSGSDAKVEAYMDENGYDFKVLNDVDGKWARQFKVQAFPTTFIYDPKGKLRFTEVGYTTTAGLKARLAMVQ